MQSRNERTKKRHVSCLESNVLIGHDKTIDLESKKEELEIAAHYAVISEHL